MPPRPSVRIIWKGPVADGRTSGKLAGSRGHGVHCSRSEVTKCRIPCSHSRTPSKKSFIDVLSPRVFSRNGPLARKLSEFARNFRGFVLGFIVQSESPEQRFSPAFRGQLAGFELYSLLLENFAVRVSVPYEGYTPPQYAHSQQPFPDLRRPASGSGSAVLLLQLPLVGECMCFLRASFLG